MEGKHLSRKAQLTFVLFAVLACIGCDQASKHLARHALRGSPVSILHDAVRFELVENNGGFLSLGVRFSDGPRHLFFLILVPLVLVGVVVKAFRSRHTDTARLLALSLVLGGGAGNLLDRITNHGAVIDFISLGIGPWRSGIFNLADVAILVGLIAYLLRGRGECARPEPNPDVAT